MDTTITDAEFEQALEQLGMQTDQPEAYKALVAGNLEVAGLVDTVELPTTPIPTRDWHRPEPEDNPLGAWYVRTEVSGDNGGPLTGKTVALKDTVLLAGVPVTGGTSILEGYMPDRDAEIVTRLLNAGATIKGKAVCEAYCFSGGSHTSVTGPVHNPHNRLHTTGGSSSGSGALVANGDVDMAIGCDQGGSIRVPASYCGIVGLKPTYGLVPYTGILGMNPNIDHTGPMTRTVADNALLLEVLAGPDGIDSRQCAIEVSAYTAALNDEVSDLRVGIVTEGFGDANEPGSATASVRAAAAALGDLGAKLSEISIPMHLLAGGISFAGLQSMLTSMFHLDGCLLERPDVVPVGYQALQRHWRERLDELPDQLRVSLLTIQILENRYGYSYISKAMEALPLVRAAYDNALEQVDVLLMPTTHTCAPPLPAADASAEENMAAAFGPLINTMPFNSTHHPALSVPCGMRDGLPVGMMLVGRHFEESTLYRLAHAFEQQQDWRER